MLNFVFLSCEEGAVRGWRPWIFASLWNRSTNERRKRNADGLLFDKRNRPWKISFNRRIRTTLPRITNEKVSVLRFAQWMLLCYNIVNEEG